MEEVNLAAKSLEDLQYIAKMMGLRKIATYEKASINNEYDSGKQVP
jgi:hypothetical protein